MSESGNFDFSKVGNLAQHLEALIGDYWGIAYREGREARSHDTKDGAAQSKWTEIQAAIRTLATQQSADEVDSFLTQQLRMWKDEGIPAPLNELQSLHAWLIFLAKNGAEKTLETMRTRMVLLQRAALDLHKAGPEAVEKAGIYDNRPEMRPASSDAATGGAEA